MVIKVPVKSPTSSVIFALSSVANRHDVSQKNQQTGAFSDLKKVRPGPRPAATVQGSASSMPSFVNSCRYT